jgi:hypothetical protein
MSIFEKLSRIDSRIIFWITVVVIIVPILRPLGLPIPVSDYTRDLHQFVTDLPDGSHVAVAMDCSVGQWPSLEPGWVVMLKLFFSLDLKLVFWSIDSTGPRCLDLALKEIPEYLEGKVYGVDYAIFDYIPGVESAVASLASDTIGTLGSDRYGTPAGDLEIMQGITDAHDFAAVWCYEQGVGSTDAYLRHWATAYDVPFIQGRSPGGIQDVLRYYPREVKGILVGSLGAAELELITRRPWKAIQMMDVQNLIHVFLILFVIAGNIMYWGSKASGTGRTRETITPETTGG